LDLKNEQDNEDVCFQLSINIEFSISKMMIVQLFFLSFMLTFLTFSIIKHLIY